MSLSQFYANIRNNYILNFLCNEKILKSKLKKKPKNNLEYKEETERKC